MAWVMVMARGLLRCYTHNPTETQEAMECLPT